MSYKLIVENLNLITTKEAAEKLGVSMRRITALIQKGRLPSTQIGREHLIKKSDLELVRERKTGRPTKWVNSIQLKFSNLSKNEVINSKELNEVIESIFHGKSEPLKNTENGLILKYNFDKPLLREEALQKRNDLFSRLYHNLQINVEAHLLMLIDESQ